MDGFGRPHAALLCAALTLGAQAASAQTLRVDHDQVRTWNRFAKSLQILHEQAIANGDLVSERVTGGYATHPDFYRETTFSRRSDGQPVTRVRWESAAPDRLHSIDVFEYDSGGAIARDYSAVYLPEHRNAPIQTLINLHAHNGALNAFRQFDASGVWIYEQCSGEVNGEPVMISLDEDELPVHTGSMPRGVSEALYEACFAALPTRATDELTRLAALLPQPRTAGDAAARREEDVRFLTGLLAVSPDEPQWYLDRGRAQFDLHRFDEAVLDLDQALTLAPDLDEALFWRGMAKGRAGDVRDGIADLSEYIRRHPDSALAYTKRGVRYIWVQEYALARADLERAVQLDPASAEAHDDLGVLYARDGLLEAAEQHFLAAIRHEPDYQKAHHNLAIVKHLAGNHEAALSRIDDALRLAPDSRDGLLLKAEILTALGRDQAATAITERAEFLPEGNWSERLPE